MRIDAHAHVFGEARFVGREPSLLVPAERTAPVDVLEREMSTAGVDGVILVPLEGDDREVAQAASEASVPSRVVAVATEAEQGRGGVDPVEAFARRREATGCVALRSTWLAEEGAPLADSPMLPVLSRMAREGIALWSYLPPGQAQHLEELALLVPDLVVVLNHLGFAPRDMRVDGDWRPSFTDPLPEAEVARIEALARHEGFHLMVSGHYALSVQGAPYTDLLDTTRRLVAAFGTSRSLWGSDFPWIVGEPGYSETLASVDRLLAGLSESERADVLGGTAERLFFSPSPQH